MIYAYVRNWEKGRPPRIEDEKDRADILSYAQTAGWTIDKWHFGGRAATVLLQMKQGDVLLTPEVCHLGDSLREVQKLISSCVSRRVKIIVTQDTYVFDDSLSTQLLITAMETAAKIIAGIKSQNMRKALQKLRCQGKKLGRPQGSANKKCKLSGNEDVIRKLLAQNVSKSEISRRLGVNRMTLYAFLKKTDI